MKVKTVNGSEFWDKEKNPTLCMSTLRAFEVCHKCDVFKKAFERKQINKLECNYKITDEAFNLLTEKRKLLNKLNQINKKLRGGRKCSMMT